MNTTSSIMSLDLMDSLHLIALHCQRDKWLDMGERRRGGTKSPISSETHTEQRGAEQNCHKERGKSLGDMQPSFHTPKTAVRKSWLLTGAGQGWWPTMHQLKEISPHNSM